MVSTIKDLVITWESKATKLLVGKKVKQVRYLSAEEAREMCWDSRAIVIIFEDGTFIYPSADDEGNDAGALVTSSEDLPVIPVI